MSDFLRAPDRALERLSKLHPKSIDLTLGRTERLLAALGAPERRLPPIVHVAGTNGKGSTIAVLRAITEASGLKTHVFTSPHLVRLAERIRLAGTLIGDQALHDLLERVETANAGQPITFFEITAAAALLAFSETPADVLLLEVGLGGRYDATNVIPAPAVSVITPIDHDHREFLGTTLAEIASAKAGILKPGVPAVVAFQDSEALAVIEAEAEAVGARLILQGRDFDAHQERGRLVVQFGDRLYDLPPPGLAGAHQYANAGLAVVAALALGRAEIDADAISKGVFTAAWPGRLQRLSAGPLSDLAQARGADLWLDGAHNPHGAQALARFAAGLKARDGRPVTLIVGLLANKDWTGVFEALAPIRPRIVTTGFDAPTAADPAQLAEAARGVGLEAQAAPNVTAALNLALAAEGPAPHVLIAGSLYLAGEVLSLSPETTPS